MKNLPPPKDKRGYTSEELKTICKKLKIPQKKFDDAFGVNTYLLAEDGTPRYYVIDVERALYILNKPGGKYHLWD